MIYVTGDTHAHIDIDKLNQTHFPEQVGLTKDDYLIILGDFGFVWDGGKNDMCGQDLLRSKPWTTLFIDGNHDCHPMLWEFPEKEMFGSTVREINESIFYLERGNVYAIDGYTFLTLGGADSIDRQFRTSGFDWWETESIRVDDYCAAINNSNKLRISNKPLDFVLTHCAPDFIEPKIGEYIYKTQSSIRLGDLAYHIPPFKSWLFGHYHIDGTYYHKYFPNSTFHALYNRVLDITKCF